eukprot:TRINITY_DN12181_c1_g1_i1.p1 TRINITY_DN12181_c1_g1~~TRINITY_DN12181_c1_g1_i1.p1  ORF type:complete len:297 (-),score=87.11 TRINITY_DN12181_c1_g1_i1:134-1024(-)
MKRKEIEEGVGGTTDYDKNNNQNEAFRNISSHLLLSLQHFQQANPTLEDLQDLLNNIHSKTQALKWSTFPKDLWPSTFLHLNSLKDFHNAQQVCKHWNTILTSETFWESFVSFKWQLDPSIKTQYTVPASKYAKLRMYCREKCDGVGLWYYVVYCCEKIKCSTGESRVTSNCVVHFSTNQVGFICSNWCYEDFVDERREMVSSGFCRIVCGGYSSVWFGCDSELFVLDNVIERCESGWKENEQFGEIRRMLGCYTGWKELIHEVVDFSVDGSGDTSVWSLNDGGYSWEGFLDYFLI